ncbi:cobyric acid synthase [Hankyongella ginsenosidimutans]|uniref:cobyric acid synthase n=1 Tax=Hankyongella ginsenosidimutans TaxID=1763828 RepID=UPI001FEC0133|nr:cobyric acid synthase [Hankyongella ginsenosidimutans]
MSAALMLQGTGSDVGKSVLVAGLCRLFANRGLQVRPFKPQNMSNNAAVTADGGEIGRAQALQALACRVAACVHMNPVLLKPQSDTGAQIVVQGRVQGTWRAGDYAARKPDLLARVLESFARLRADADLVIVEGAGSPAETNLRADDIANMGFARAANVPVLLVGDIDRGGVIASLVGTHAVLDPLDRAQVRGFLINKFRGDIGLFDAGLDAITRHTGWPGFGVVPWLADAARLPAEDAVVLERTAKPSDGAVTVVCPMLPRIANFDDLDPLRQQPGCGWCLRRRADRCRPPTGSSCPAPRRRSPISRSCARRVGHRHSGACPSRGFVLGLCGGYQMLGQRIADPDGIEGPPGEAAGLGLLDVETVLAPHKVLRRTSGMIGNAPFQGYEIHCGRTTGRTAPPHCYNLQVAARTARCAGG